jgi:hypothetical protein
MISLTYDWERAYIDAILETDDEKLTKRIDTAEEKLLARISDLSNDRGGNSEEVQALAYSDGRAAQNENRAVAHDALVIAAY